MKLKDFLIGILVSLTWGGNFIMVKLGLDYLPPLLMTFLRFALVTAILLPIAPKPDISWRIITMIAFVLGLVHHGALFIALWLGVDLAIGVIVMQCSVPVTALLGFIFLSEKLNLKSIFGIAVAFCGIIIIVDGPKMTNSAIAITFLIIAVMGLAIFNILVRKIGEFNVISMTAYSGLITAIMLLPLTIILEEPYFYLLPKIPLIAGLSIFYTALSSIVGFGLWFYLLQRYPVGIVSPFFIFTPICALFFYVIFLGENLTANLIYGSLVTIVGISIILMPKSLRDILTKRRRKTDLVVVLE